MDALDLLLFGAFGLGFLFIAVGCVLLRRAYRDIRLGDEHDIAGVGALDAARLRGADLSHGAATVQRRGGV